MKPSDSSKGKARIFYARMDEFWRKGQKFAFLEEKQHVGNIEWQELKPDAKHNWLTSDLQPEFDVFLSLGNKEAKIDETRAETIFRLYSAGINTARDAWVYNFDQEILTASVLKTSDFFNQQVSKWNQRKDRNTSIDDFVSDDGSNISWSEGLKKALVRGITIDYDEGSLRNASYRPFTRTYIYFDPHLNERRYQLPYIFPAYFSELENHAICVAGIGDRKGFGSLMTKYVPSYDLAFEKTQCFPYYTYNEDGTNRRENITDWALEKFRKHYGDKSISKWDIFHYVYAVLHHPVYRERYAANLKRELPRVPFAPDFKAFAAAGARLAEIHVNYERQPEYPLERIETPTAALDWRVERMKLGKDKRTLQYNEYLTLHGIPPEAFEYRLGNRSALEWVVDQYQVSTDRRSGITNDPNRADDPQYIVRLVGQVINVSLETRGIVNDLPELGVEEGSTP